MRLRGIHAHRPMEPPTGVLTNRAVELPTSGLVVRPLDKIHFGGYHVKSMFQLLLRPEEEIEHDRKNKYLSHALQKPQNRTGQHMESKAHTYM